MKICVLVPSEEYLNQAGVRIRYRRIAGHLGDFGHDLDVIPIQDFNHWDDFKHDVYIVSKIYDARSLIAARMLKTRGIRIGVDLFDNYFSQKQDCRFVRLRLWANALLEASDFALCSTASMAEVVHGMAPSMLIHTLNDPSPALDMSRIGTDLKHKLTQVLRSSQFTVAWFGIGDNPHFPVGLADLVAFGGSLARLRRGRFNVRLAILTNRRSMTADNLASLRRIPLAYTIEEWTEEQEAALLAGSFVCFLPVNGQNFSIGKSLNRAVTALTAGVQVLSSGYPLYEPLAPFVYRDPARLLDDLDRCTLSLREETLPDLASIMHEWADSKVEAERLSAFLERVRQPPRSNVGVEPAAPFAAVIHGKHTMGQAHKLVQRLGGLSIASPFSSQKLNYDVRFSFGEHEPWLDLYVSRKSSALLPAELRGMLVPAGTISGRIFNKLDLARIDESCSLPGTAIGRFGATIDIVASYAHVMQTIRKATARMFPGVPQIVAENSPLPLLPGTPDDSVGSGLA